MGEINKIIITFILCLIFTIPSFADSGNAALNPNTLKKSAQEDRIPRGLYPSPKTINENAVELTQPQELPKAQLVSFGELFFRAMKVLAAIIGLILLLSFITMIIKNIILATRGKKPYYQDNEFNNISEAVKDFFTTIKG